MIQRRGLEEACEGSADRTALGLDGDGLRRIARASKDDRQVRRLLALAAIYGGDTRSEAACIGGAGLQIERDWLTRFNERGPVGLIDGKAPFRGLAQCNAVRYCVSSSFRPIPASHRVVRWRLVDLAQWFSDDFGN